MPIDSRGPVPRGSAEPRRKPVRRDVAARGASDCNVAGRSVTAATEMSAIPAVRGRDQPAGASRALKAAAMAPFVPAAAVVALWILLARRDGGYFPATWYPAAIVLCVLLVVLLGAGRRLPSIRALRVALGLLAALVAVSFASMLWAQSPGTAWETSNQLALLALGATVVALTPWTPRSAAVLLGGWAAGVAALCALTMVDALRADTLARWFDAYRWAQPTGYPNGAAALALLAFWPALLLSSRRQTPAVLRVLLLPVAVFLLLFSLLPQSRGSVVGLAVVTPLLFGLASQRLRLLARAVVALAAALVAGDPIFRVYETVVTGGRVAPVLHHAFRVIGFVTAGAVVAALGLVVIEHAAAGRPRVVTGARRGSVALVATVVAVGVVVAMLNASTIVRDVNERWATMSSGRETDLPTGPRLGADISDERTDYWRVSLDLFRQAPVLGVGAGNFEHHYTVARRLPTPARYPHDVWLRFLGENGAVGLLLIIGFVAVALGAPIAVWRRMDRSSRGVVALCVAMTAYFFVHASFDWLDRIPAIAGPALAVPFIALRLVGIRAQPKEGGSLAWRRAVTGAALVGLLALTASLAVPWMAVRHRDRALATWRADPQRAFAELDRAARANPLSSQALLSKGAIAVRLGRSHTARGAFRAAIRVEEDWLPHFELALLDARSGRFASAGREIRRAGELSASDAFVAKAAAQIASRNRIDPIAVNRELFKLTFYKQQQIA